MSAHSEITSQRSCILRPDQLPRKDRGGGAQTVPLVTASRGATGFLNGITEFAPGAAIAHHTHNVAESVMVIEGVAVVDIDGERETLHVHDTTFVPGNVPHHFENASDTAPMRIFWTYASVDATRTIVESGEHGRVDGESAMVVSAPRSVREVAAFTVLPGHEAAFEQAVSAAVPLFQRAHGARQLVLVRSDEQPQAYRLIVTWDSVDDHVEAFRGSEDFASWRALIADHVSDDVAVEHVREVLTGF